MLESADVLDMSRKASICELSRAKSSVLAPPSILLWYDSEKFAGKCRTPITFPSLTACMASSRLSNGTCIKTPVMNPARRRFTSSLVS